MGTGERGQGADELLRVPFKYFAVVTVSLPALSLLFSFLHGIIFRFDEVNETVCQAQNIIPSISAVTGITPGSYAWRTGIAVHSSPRVAVGIMYYNYYKARITNISEKYRSFYLKLLSVNFWIYIIENSCLVAVAFISNKDNYPLHEKIFVVFMVTCCCYMLLNTLLYQWSRTSVLTNIEKKSLKIKWIGFASIMTATAGLLYAFALHRIWCVPFAFSWFSACEYVIAYSSMGYQFSAYYEFRNEPGDSEDSIQNTYSNGDLNKAEEIQPLKPSGEIDMERKRNLRPRKTTTGEKAQ